MIGDNLKGDLLYAYVAGIIDGEGSINIYRVTTLKDKPRFAMRIAVGITDPWLPQFLKIHFGGSVWLAKHNNPKHKDCWFWQISAKKAAPFLSHIIPYLCIKKPQAELALQWQSRKHKRHFLTDAERILDSADKILMSTYNKRGPSNLGKKEVIQNGSGFDLR